MEKFIPKIWVLDRIEQSFQIFIKHPFALVIPLAIFHIVMIEILPVIWTNVLLSNNHIDTTSITSLVYLVIGISVIYALFFLILIIPITIWIIKWVSDIIHWKHIHMQEMMIYGVTQIWKAFKIYWYMFAYAYLIPALCFIAAWIITLAAMHTGNEPFVSLWTGLMVASAIYASIQGIYRWIKSSFSIPWAIYENDFSEEYFYKTISYTQWKWWRIVWNFILVGIIAALLMWLVGWLLWAIWFISNDSLNILSEYETSSLGFEWIVWSIWSFNLVTFIINSISQILASIVTAFMIVFSLVFYIRLKYESWENVLPNKTKEEIQIQEL